ncbi:hypothetical protein SAMN05444920_102518 [Nonomuraea solani]|uniref:Uncharacterized protein n=1 Tax=Nonomuraea solani TaxID=1144553 RepID=A0A1H5Z2R1_9ACTN|nr:hypothetical protein [Nonomuraea solani]SEG30578.1 hypothetical protein SAMN05444920_102518 [Nonomuraea solani]
MTEIIKALVDPDKIERHLGGIVDIEDISAEWRVHEFGTTNELWSGSCPDAIALHSTRCEEALIKYELWDGEPPFASGWGESRAGSVHLISGMVRATSTQSGFRTRHETFDLGCRDQEWRFRIHRKFLGHEDFPTDIVDLVLFKLQFWSAEAGDVPREER